MKLSRPVAFYTAFVFALFVLRLFIGVDFTDESQYAAQTYTPLLGVAPFEVDLLIQQTAGLLLYPLTKIYVALFHTEGFVIFLRLAYAALALLTSWVAFLYFRKSYPPILAFMAASLMWLFVPGSIPSWSYNTVSLLGFPLSLFLLFGWGAGWAFVGGLVAAVACFCYPTLALAYLVVVGCSWWNVFQGRWPRANHLAFLVAALLGGGASLTFMFGVVGSDKIHDLFVFSKSFGELGGIEKFEHFADRFLDGFRRTLYVLIFPILAYLRWKKGADWFRRNLSKILILGLLTAAFARVAPQKSMGWMIYASLFLFCVLFARLLEFRKIHDERWLFLTSGFVAAFVYAYSSGNGFLLAAFGLLLTVQILTLEASRVFSANFTNLKPAVVFFALLGLYFTFHNYYFLYRGQTLSEVRYMIHEGPHRYLLTSKKQKDFVEKIGPELKELSKSYKTLFAAYFTPAYLYTTMRPVTGMLYAHERDWPELQLNMIMYRSLKHDEWPELVLIRQSEKPGFVHQFENRFLASGKYDPFIEKPEYRIFRRKDLALGSEHDRQN